MESSGGLTIPAHGVGGSWIAKLPSAQFPATLIFTPSSGLLNATSLSSSDADILESLLDDASEAFFYGFQSGAAHRFLGARFRGDDGTTKNYSGPWFDIFLTITSAQAQPNAPKRQKLYYFNSDTQQLAKVQYQIPGSVAVTTEFNNWTTTAHQSFPGQIVRKENGATVFTFNINSATVSPAVTDGIFQGN